jgi:hypothetical protein
LDLRYGKATVEAESGQLDLGESGADSCLKAALAGERSPLRGRAGSGFPLSRAPEADAKG